MNKQLRKQTEKQIAIEINEIVKIDANKWLNTHDVLIWFNSFYWKLLNLIGKALNSWEYEPEHIANIFRYIVRSKLNIERAILGPDENNNYYIKELEECAKVESKIIITRKNNNLENIERLFLKLECLYRNIRNRMMENKIFCYNNFISVAILWNFHALHLIQYYFPKKLINNERNVLIENQERSSGALVGLGLWTPEEGND